MITPGLEQAIQKGIAQYHSFTLGASGVGTIPCPDNQFIIITDFDYFNFLDIPFADPGAPAQADVILDPGAQNPVPGQWQFGGGIFFITVLLDFTDLIGTQANIQAQLDLNAPGWTVIVADQGGPVSFTFITNNTDDFNNTSAVFIPDNPVGAPVPIFDQKFVGGVDPVLLDLQAVLARSVHQLEFRTRKSRNHFVIRDDVKVFNGSIFGVPGPQNYFLSVTGKYQKDTYLVHDEDVQVNILTVPHPPLWAVNMNQNNNISQENSQPVGYGQSPTGETALQELFFDAIGPTQYYQALTQKRSGIPLASPLQYREQFRVDPNPINVLNNPQNLGGVFWNERSYPILNVGYVSINKNENQFVLPSNG